MNHLGSAFRRRDIYNLCYDFGRFLTMLVSGILQYIPIQ